MVVLMTQMTDPELLAAVESFLRRTGLAPSRFGELSCGDRNLIFDLREGERELKRSTIGKVEKWMAGFEFGLAHAGAGQNSNTAPARPVDAKSTSVPSQASRNPASDSCS